jgi:hypothetical protein
VSQGRSVKRRHYTKKPSRAKAAAGLPRFKLVAGKQKAAGLDRFGEAATHRAQGEGGNGTFRFDGQARRFTGKFEAAIEMQARLLKEFR